MSPPRRRRSAPAKARAATRPATRTDSPAALAQLGDEALLEAVQRRTFRFFWEGADRTTGLAPDRRNERRALPADLVTSGGSGFGIMSLLVGAERGWVSRSAVRARLATMLDFLFKATCFHGAFPHFMNARTGACIPLMRKDDGGDLVETALLCMGMICAREYFDRDIPAEAALRGRIDQLWRDVEWSWYARDGADVLYWHWSPNNGWAMNHAIRGWNECLVAYVLAAGAPRYPVDPAVYHSGFATGAAFRNGAEYFGETLPLGPPGGGPLFFAHYSFCGLDPRGLSDRYADYWRQNVAHTRIQRAYAIANPQRFAGYGADSWGFTASDDPEAGYRTHAVGDDNGTLTPSAALSSLPYAPAEVIAVLRHWLTAHGTRVWRRYGFVDAFNPRLGWYADTFLAIDQGPIVVMIENHRSQLLWRLFMRAAEVRTGLGRLGFSSPHLTAAGASRAEP